MYLAQYRKENKTEKKHQWFHFQMTFKADLNEEWDKSRFWNHEKACLFEAHMEFPLFRVYVNLREPKIKF